MALGGNKFYNTSISAPQLSGEVNYSAPTAQLAGSSYTPQNKYYGRFYTPPTPQSMKPYNAYDYMTNIPSNNPYKTIQNYDYALGMAGQTAPQREGTGLGNVLMGALDLLSRPQYAITNLVSDLTDSKKDSFGEVLGDMWKGITGEKKSSFTDVLSNLGWEHKANPDAKWYNPTTWDWGNVARGAVGFIGDVLLDPTTYLTMGGSAVAKGVGTAAIKGGVKEMAEKTLREAGELGAKAINSSKDDIVKGLSDIFTSVGKSDADSFVRNSLTRLGEKEGDLASRIAYAFGQSLDLSRPAVAEQAKDVMSDLLTKGIGAVNKDTIMDVIKSPLERTYSKLTTALPKDELASRVAKDFSIRDTYTQLPDAEEAFNRTVGQVFGKKFGNDALFPEWGIKKGKKTLTVDQKTFREATVRDLSEVLSASSYVSVPVAKKWDMISGVYKLGNNANIRTASDIMQMSDREFAVLDTLFDAFNVSDVAQAERLVEAAQGLGRTSKATTGRVGELIQNLDEVRGSVRRIDNGIEFANGLQRVYDNAEKAFYLRFHNIFTGQTHNIVELTNVIRTDKMRKAWNAIVSADFLSPVVNGVGKVIGGTAKAFQTEYINKGIQRLGEGKVDERLYDSAKSFAKNISKYMRFETAIPQYAKQSLHIFNEIPEFFENPHLRTAASVYIERNNSDLGKAAWLFLTKQSPDAGADQAFKNLYADIANGSTPGGLAIRNKLNSIHYTSEMLPSIQKVGVQNLAYNTAIAQFDGSVGNKFASYSGNKVPLKSSDWDDNALDFEDYLSRAASGNIDADTAASYLRIYDNTDMSKLNPLANEGKPTRRSQIREELNASAQTLGGVKDSVTGATAVRTGAFEQRKYRSALDRLYYNPTHDIDLDVATRVARRTMESERVALNKSLINSIDDYIENAPGFSRLVSRKEVEGLRKKTVGDTTYYVHPEIENQLNRVAQVFDSALGSQNALGEVLRGLTNSLKGLQTKWNPSFVLRNAIGEPMMNWIAGVSAEAGNVANAVLRESRAGQLFRIGDTTFGTTDNGVQKLYRDYVTKEGDRLVNGYNAADISAERVKSEAVKNAGINVKRYNVNGQNMTANEIMGEFYDAGLSWSGITRGNQAKNMKQMLDEDLPHMARTSGVRSATNKVRTGLGGIGDYIETQTRLAHYVDARMRGMDKTSAALEVRKYHVDYKDLTNFERNVLRNVMPFYTYMRKNLPIQLNVLLHNTNKVSMISHLVNSAYEINTENNGGKELAVPDYLKEGLAIPIDVDEDGNVTYLNWGIPLTDIARLKYNFGEMLTENVFSMLSPFIKFPLETAMNKDMMYGSTVQDYAGETTELLRDVEGSPQTPVLVDRLLQNLGIVNTLRKTVSGATAAIQGGGSFGEVLGTIGQQMLGSALPTKNQTDVQDQQAYDYRDQLYEYIQRLRAQGVAVPQYTPALQFKMPYNPWMVSNRLASQSQSGYLGVSDDQLFPSFLRNLTGR